MALKNSDYITYDVLSDALDIVKQYIDQHGGGGATYTAGDNITISEDNVISAINTIYTAGGNVTITDDNVINVTIPAKYLDKTATGVQELAGSLKVGSHTTNVVNAYLHVRKVASSITGYSVNGACFSVNGDGTASFQHKIYDNNGNNAKNSAVLRFSNKGLQFGINSTSGASPAESDYKNVAMVDDIPEVTPVLTTGTKIATIGDKDLYAPAGGGGGGSYLKLTIPAQTYTVTHNSSKEVLRLQVDSDSTVEFSSLTGNDGLEKIEFVGNTESLRASWTDGDVWCFDAYVKCWKKNSSYLVEGIGHFKWDKSKTFIELVSVDEALSYDNYFRVNKFYPARISLANLTYTIE